MGVKLIHCNGTTGVVEEAPGYFRGRGKIGHSTFFLQETADYFVFIEINNHLKVGRQAVDSTGSDLSLHVFDKFLKMQIIAVEAFQTGLFTWNKHKFELHHLFQGSVLRDKTKNVITGIYLRVASRDSHLTDQLPPFSPQQ
jgi:hypothetical protein